MGKFVLVACTNVGRYIIEEFMNNSEIGAELVGVVNLNQEQAISKANYDSYADLVLKYNFPIFYCNNINDIECIDFMKNLKPDVILQSGWSQKFSDDVLNIPKYCCIGEHPAPLPKGRGAACVNWAILTGEKEWGDSYFKMVSEYDKGELYAQKFFNIEQFDTVFTVYEKVAKCAADVVAEYAKKWSNGLFDTVIQDDTKATYYKKRRPADGEIKDFSQTAVVLHNFIRAQTHPYPGTFIKTSTGNLLILSSSVSQNTTKELPGTVFSKADNTGGVLVACGDGSVLEINRIKPETSPSMWATDYFADFELPFNICNI